MELNVSNSLKMVLTQLSELYAVYWLLQKSGDFLVVSWILVACVLLGNIAVPHVFFKATYFHCNRLETIVGTVHWSSVVWVKMDSVSIMLDTVLSLSWGDYVKSLLILYVHMLELCHSFVVEQQVELTVSHYTFTTAELAVCGKTEILSQTMVTDYIFTWWSPKKILLHVKRLICCKAHVICADEQTLKYSL